MQQEKGHFLTELGKKTSMYSKSQYLQIFTPVWSIIYSNTLELTLGLVVISGPFATAGTGIGAVSRRSRCGGSE